MPRVESRLWGKTAGCPTVRSQPASAGLSRRPFFLRLAWFTSFLLLWLCATVKDSTANPAAFAQVNAATPQTAQSQVAVTYSQAQAVGDTNILAIGWRNATSNVSSVADSAGNTYQVAVATGRGTGLSQAIYYAKNIKAAAAGTNTVTVTFDSATPSIDVRATEYTGLDPTSPFDVGRSVSGNSATARSGVTRSAASELIFVAGTTTGAFSTAGPGFTSRIVTSPDADIVEDTFIGGAGVVAATAPLTASAAWVM